MIRIAAETDSARIAELSSALGRSAEQAVIAECLRRMAPDEREVVFVAVGAAGHVEGWLHAGRREVLGGVPRAEIVGLVVDPASRSEGMGRALVRAAERWAAEHGLERVVVRSNVKRDVAHEFYRRVGYAPAKTQNMYEKRLGP